MADTTYTDTRFSTLENMLEGFMLSQASTNFPPPQMVSCSQCQSTDHSLSACPLFVQQLATSQEQGQVNVAFQRQNFDPCSPTYNLG